MFARVECVSVPEVLARVQDGLAVTVGQYKERRLSYQGTRLHEVLKSYLDVLVIDFKLLFQRIQVWVFEDLPPLAAQHAFLRIGDLPALRAWKLTGHSLEFEEVGGWYFGPKKHAGQSSRHSAMTTPAVGGLS